MFDHVTSDFKLQELECETLPTGRTYTTPEGKKYPSVTTILGASEDSKDGLNAWRQRIGEEEADKITRQAGARGTAVHNLAENYINNDPDWAKGAMPAHLFTFHQIKPLIDHHMNNVHVQEASLYSDHLQIAGRVDLIADWNGKLSIIDFKTARKPKKEEYIQNYFMQTAFYAAAFYERTGIAIKQSVILISVDHEPSQVFIKTPHDYLPALMQVRKKYKNLYGF